MNKIMRLLQDFFFLILYVNKILIKAMIGNLLFICSCSWLNMTFEAWYIVVIFLVKLQLEIAGALLAWFFY